MNEQLSELAARCERTQGRDPWLNRDIEVAVGRGRNCDDATRQKDAYAMPLHRVDYYVAPAYSTAFDVALTLMKLLPAPVYIHLRPCSEDNLYGHLWNVGLTRLEEEGTPMGWQGWAKNPALALSAALLRALSNPPSEEMTR